VDGACSHDARARVQVCGGAIDRRGGRGAARRSDRDAARGRHGSRAEPEAPAADAENDRQQIVSIKRIAALHERSADRLGAGVTLREIAGDARLRDGHTAFWRGASQVATPHIRNMGTLGGNLCLDTRCNYYNQNLEWRKAIDFCMKAPHGEALKTRDGGTCWVAPGSPRCWAVSSTDTAPGLIALGARETLVSKDGERTIPLADLYADDGMAYLSKRADEILTSVVLPRADGWKSTYWKLRRRGSFDFPVLGVAAAVRMVKGVVEEARVVLGAVASHPVVVPINGLVGKPLDDASIDHFAETWSRPAKPLDNTDFALGWRKRVARSYLAGVLRELRGDDPSALGLQARRAIAMLPVLAT
jgi:4-hydroxybenzoyl-CoA reductase subunit beta